MFTKKMVVRVHTAVRLESLIAELAKQGLQIDSLDEWGWEFGNPTIALVERNGEVIDVIPSPGATFDASTERFTEDKMVLGGSIVLVKPL